MLYFYFYFAWSPQESAVKCKTVWLLDHLVEFEKRGQILVRLIMVSAPLLGERWGKPGGALLGGTACLS